MKKLLRIVFTAMMLSTLSSTNARDVRPKIQRKNPSTNTAQQKIVRKKRNLPAPKGKTSPEQLLRTTQQVQRDTKKLNADVKKKSSEKVILADVKKAEANIEKIEQQLANLRTWSGDFLPKNYGGYSPAEINKAMDIASPYIKESEALKLRIKDNQEKIAQLTAPDKEKERTYYRRLIAVDEIRLEKLAPIIAQKKLIMGEKLSNALIAAYATIATIALTFGAYVYSGYTLSSTVAAKLAAAYSAVSSYTPTPVIKAASTAKAAWDYLRGNTPTTLNTSTINQGLEIISQDDEITPEAASSFKSMVLPGLKTLTNIAADNVKTTLAHAFAAEVQIATRSALSTLYEQLSALANDPEADPDELLAVNEALKKELAKERAKNKK